ncbi:Crp/Fnr family transcriptional regulator [Streptomyces termitum]|uniref:Crp/Fnr family transcriptional regulator n=1 Tax=Streptomyces termitum TaxID=67368 RepID=UPI0037A7CD64
MSEENCLRSSPLGTLVPSEEWERLTQYAPQTYLAGRVLLHQGSEGTHVLALVEGLVKVVRHESDGRRRLFGFRGPGEILGEMALRPGKSRMATVTALEKSRAHIIPADEFRRLVRENGLALPIAELAQNRMHEEADLCEGAVDRRLALALLRLMTAAGGRRCFSLSREDLAQHVGVGRKAVSKALELLGPECVTTGNRRIEVVDVQKLHHAAGLVGS